MRHVKVSLVVLTGIYTLTASPAFAYLDGATGSMILQGLVAGAATILMFGRTQIARVKTFVAGLRKAKAQDSE